MIKILATICLLHAPSQCRELTVSNSDFANLTMTDCLVGMRILRIGCAAIRRTGSLAGSARSADVIGGPFEP